VIGSFPPFQLRLPRAAPVQTIPPARDSSRNTARLGSTCTILALWVSPFEGKVRAVFLKPVACNLMASRGGPSDETPSSEESGQLSAISGQ
jgi:hypothetical protein